MKSVSITTLETKVLAALAIFGASIPNGVFCYNFIFAPEVTKVALSNPISLVFITEAFFLMFLVAWLLRKASSARPTGKAFIIMSILGGMVFSVPATV